MKSVFVRVGMAVTFCAAGLAAQPAKAQMMCAPRETVIERLRTGYGEDLTGVGVQSTARVFELWAAPSTGTWTVLMSLADGKTCIVASGTDWQNIDPAPVVLGVPG